MFKITCTQYYAACLQTHSQNQFGLLHILERLPFVILRKLMRVSEVNTILTRSISTEVN